MLTVTLLSQTVLADPFKLPAGKRVKIDGIELTCYSIPEFKQLMNMSVDLTTCTAKEVLLKQKISNLEKQIDEYKEIGTLHVTSIKILSQENERIFSLWKEENKRRHIAENKPQWGSWFSWGSTGVLAVVVVVLGTVIVLDN